MPDDRRQRAPALAILAPWPDIRTLLWLGLLGIAMATGLAVILRAGGEIPEGYWRTMLDYRTPAATRSGGLPSEE